MGYFPIVKKVVKDANIVLFILDARLPELSHNVDIEYLAEKHKVPFIKVFNKIDLLPKSHLHKLQRKYPHSAFVAGTKGIGIRKLKTRILIECKKRKIEFPMVGIVGYPNMGKSAIINALSKRSKAAVSRVAGTTKNIQWINAGTIKILDSPGVVPLEDNEIKLGILGAKNPEKMRRPDKVAWKIIQKFQEIKPEALEKFYDIKLEEDDDEDQILDKIAQSRGFLQKGATPDENRTIYQLIRDWQSGKLGF